VATICIFPDWPGSERTINNAKPLNAPLAMVSVEWFHGCSGAIVRGLNPGCAADGEMDQII
jgi:hypothetical protein